MKVRVLMVLASLALAASPAAAQQATAQAETLFRKGQELLAQGKTAEACDAFDASQRLEPAVSTQLNQANCRVKNGQLATAWAIFVDAARQTRGATDASQQQLHKVAADKARKLEARLSTLTIRVPAGSRVRGLEILRDGVAVDPATWDTALPIDGGAHEVTARAPGNAEWSSKIVVGVERDSKIIEIPQLKAAALGGPVKSKIVEDPEEEPAPASGGRSKVLPLALGGAAIVLAGGAVGLELWGQSTYEKAERERDLAKQTDLWHSANRKRYAAEAAGVAALGCAGVAVWLYLRSGSEPERVEEEEITRRVRVRPLITRDAGGIVFAGAF